MRARIMAKLGLAAGFTLAALTQVACSSAQLSRDFGVALRQNIAAQIANPDVWYVALPGADGARVGLAQERYRTGTVLAPSSVGASDIGSSAGSARP